MKEYLDANVGKGEAWKRFTSCHNSGTEPMSRLTRIAEAMVKAAEGHPEFLPDDRLVVLLDLGHQQHGNEDDVGLAARGFDDELAAATLIAQSLDGLLELHGLRLEIKPR